MNNNAVVVSPPEEADACVIWLHGLGADGHDFEPIVSGFAASLRRHTLFVFPHAEHLPVTINGGMVMPAWYDIYDTNFGTRVDTDGMSRSQSRIEDIIAQAIQKGIKSERIVLAGFSQGGVIALRTALTYETNLAGVLALSTYLPGKESLEARLRSAPQRLPIFLAHGSTDPLIPLEAARQARDDLIGWGFAVQWQTYAMQHAVCPEEVNDIEKWLSATLSR